MNASVRVMNSALQDLEDHISRTGDEEQFKACRQFRRTITEEQTQALFNYIKSAISAEQKQIAALQF